MFDIYLLIVILVSAALAALGSTVFLKDRKSNLGRIYMGIVISITVWIVTNHISNNINYSPKTAIIANYFVFSASFLSAALMLRFSIGITEDKKALQIYNRCLPLIAAITIVSATPLVGKGVHVQGELYAVDFGPLLVLYFVALISCIVIIIWHLSVQMKKTQGLIHERVRTIFYGAILSFPLLVITLFILPVITGWFGLTNIGILTLFIPVYTFYYSVAKHGLFDLRPVIFKSLAYFAALGLLTVVYIGITSLASTLVVVQKNEAVHFAINSTFIFLVAISYGPLKNLFKRITNRFFYQDSYEQSVLFAELNKILASNIEVNHIVDKTNKLLAATIHSEYSLFCLIDGRERILIRTNRSKNNDIDADKLVLTLDGMRNGRVITDKIEETNSTLKAFLHTINAAVCVRISIRTQDTTRRLGYLVLGDKKSGYAYTKADEIVLSAVADEMAIAIQNALHYEEIQHFNETLQVRVNEATRKLKASNEKLKKMDETRDEFISMASHQLRTPLTSVKGYVSMVLDGDVGPINEQQRELLNQSFSSSQRMANLISDLLNLSRINTGKFVIEPTPVYLPQIIEVELGQLREMAQGKNIQLKLDMPATFPTLMLDENKMHQVVMNLIDNALYYTPENGTVTVSLVETPAAVEFRVIDTGIGVPKDAQHRLFSKMFRAENAQRARPDGTGLGLFLVKKVIVSQNGAIIFDSIEGKGSTFGFRFNKADHLVDATAADKPLAAAA